MLCDVIAVHIHFIQTVGEGSICISAVEPHNCEAALSSLLLVQDD